MKKVAAFAIFCILIIMVGQTLAELGGPYWYKCGHICKKHPTAKCLSYCLEGPNSLDCTKYSYFFHATNGGVIQQDEC